MRYFAWLWKASYGIRLNASVRIASGTVQVLLGLLMVWLSKRFIDETIRSGTQEDILWMIFLLVLTVVSRIVLRQVNYYMATLAITRKSNSLRLEIFSRLFASQLFGEKDMHSGDVSSRLGKDIENVANVIADVLPAMAVTAIQLLGAFLLMRFFDATLAWALVIFTPLAIILGKFLARRLKNMTLDIREKESDIQMHVQEGIEYNAVLRSLGSERWMASRLDSMQQELQGNIRRRTRFSVITRFLLGSAFGIGYLMAFVWGGIGLRNGVITFGVMTSFLQLVGQIQQPILSLLNMTPQVIHSTASIDRLEELRPAGDTGKNPASLPEAGSPKGLSPAEDSPAGKLTRGIPEIAPRAGVKFEDVTFRYAKGDREILSHFSHDFKPGTRTALMGETGVGKTTLFRLMLAFISPSTGKVSVYAGGNTPAGRNAPGASAAMCEIAVTGLNGAESEVLDSTKNAGSNGERPHGLSNVKSRDLDGAMPVDEVPASETTRENFVFVPQGNTLLSGTVRENLLLANPQAHDDELLAALHTACADFVNELPHGLDTELSERGGGLSEGQAQRIAIARGLLRPGSILLLDEISASLDEATERELYSRLFAAYPEKTMIFITHRKAICGLCDETVKV